jgi:hypothetical protein
MASSTGVPSFHRNAYCRSQNTVWVLSSIIRLVCLKVRKHILFCGSQICESLVPSLGSIFFKSPFLFKMLRVRTRNLHRGGSLSPFVVIMGGCKGKDSMGAGAVRPSSMEEPTRSIFSHFRNAYGSRTLARWCPFSPAAPLLFQTQKQSHQK